MNSEAERSRRAQAVASSVGSMALEGQVLDAFTRELNTQYIAGMISLDEFSAAVEAHVAELAGTLREQSLAVSASV